MKINLHIERLVVDEAMLTSGPAADVRIAMESELAHLLASPEAGGTLCGIGTVDAPLPLILPATLRPHDRLGTRIATVIADGLGLGAEVRTVAGTSYPSSTVSRTE